MSDESNTTVEETTLNEQSPIITTSSPVVESYTEVKQEPIEPIPQNLPDSGDSSPSMPVDGLGADGGDLNEVGIDNIPPSDGSKAENSLNSTYIEPEKTLENQALSSDTVLDDKQNEAIVEPILEPILQPMPQIPVNEALTEQVKTKPESIEISPNITEPAKIETKPETKEVEKVTEETMPKDGQAIPAIVVASQLKNIAKELLIKARNAIQTRKRKKLEKIMTLFSKQTNITNDEVEKFLHVSDATATRYLSILKKEGKIKQNGKTGQGVSYSKI